MTDGDLGTAISKRDREVVETVRNPDLAAMVGRLAVLGGGAKALWTRPYRTGLTYGHE